MRSPKERAASCRAAAAKLLGPLTLTKDLLIESEMKALYTPTLKSASVEHQMRSSELKDELKSLRREELRLVTYERLFEDFCCLPLAIERYCKAHSVSISPPRRPEFLEIFEELREELAENAARRVSYLVSVPQDEQIAHVDMRPFYDACESQCERAALFGLTMWAREHIAIQRARYAAGQI